MKQIALKISFLFFISIYSYGQIINVPGDYLSIQSAINAANDEDTVIVADGTYFENINFRGKAITVASLFLMDGDEAHIDSTIINGSQPIHPDSGSVVSFVSGEDTTSVLFGFTITGGTGTYVPAAYLMPELRAGGGIFCRSNARISNNMIVNNYITSSSMIAAGAGIQAGKGTSVADTSFVIIENNYIYLNKLNTQGSYLVSGGGIAFGCRGRITNNDISNNEITSQNVQATDGGLSFQFANLIILSGNTISYNKVNAPGNFEWGGHGGGFATFYGSNYIIKENRIFSNETNVPQKSNGAGVLLEHLTGDILFERNEVFNNYYTGNGTCHGGGISIWKCDPLIISNIIYGNTGYFGGGFFLGDSGSSPKMFNNIVYDNNAIIGGGIYVKNDHFNPCEPIIINNTISNNNATNVGGLYTKNSKILMINNILWGNTSSDGIQIQKVGGTINVVYSNIQGGWEGEGNIDGDPSLSIADSLFRLSANSPCIGAGADSVEIGGFWYHCPSTDLLGNPRPSPIDEFVDIGANESEFMPVSVKGKRERVSTSFILSQNYPNPFNPTTTIKYSILQQSYVTLKVFDVLGKQIKTLVNKEQAIGNCEVELDGSDLTSGIYFYKLQAGNFVETKKMILLR